MLIDLHVHEIEYNSLASSFRMILDGPCAALDDHFSEDQFKLPVGSVLHQVSIWIDFHSTFIQRNNSCLAFIKHVPKCIKTEIHVVFFQINIKIYIKI